MLLKLIMVAGIILFYFLSDAIFGSSTLLANIQCALLVVVGPLLGVRLAYRLSIVKGLHRSIIKMLTRPDEEDLELISQIEKIAYVWHNSGYRGLEAAAGKINHPLLRTGAGLVADGCEAGEMRKILVRQCRIYFSGRKAESNILLSLAKLTQTFGFIGTFFGMSMLLRSINDPVAIGYGMAIALLSTLHGLLLANLLYKPLYEKVRAEIRKEYKNYALIIEGVTCLAKGKSSRSISYRLHSFIGGEDNLTPRDNLVVADSHHRLAGMVSKAA